MTLLGSLVHRGRVLELVVAACTVAACAPTVRDTPAPVPVAGDHIRFTLRRDSTAFTAARFVALGPDSLVFERYVPDRAGRGGEWVADRVTTDSVAQLQVRVGRHGYVGRGLLIGSLTGLGLGALCAANANGEWLEPTDGECLASGVLSGAAVGLIVGALIRSDVWAPTGLPERPQAENVSAVR